MHGRARQSHDPQSPGRGIARRDFVIGGAAALGLGGLPLSGVAQAASTPSGAPAIRSLRRLGRTGLEMSDISFGSSRTTDPAVARYAFERGVNYFDTAEGYKGGACEEALGVALAGHRDEVILTSKVMTGASTSSQTMMRALEGSLRRLRTDRVDIYMSHAVNDVARLRNEQWHAFVEQAKAQGKIRFSGLSGHGGRLVECIDYALDHDLVDVILCAYNFGQDPSFYSRFTRSLDFIAMLPELPRVIEKAKSQDVGVIAMKTLRGARLNDMRPYEAPGSTFSQAAFRWVLGNPSVSALVVSMKSREQIDEYLGASGATGLQPGDKAMLRRYDAIASNELCLHGCNACESSCPVGVAISEVLRTRMYARSYGDIALAREDYAKLGNAASACVGCTAQGCVGACPAELAVADLTRDTAQLLG